MYAIIRPQGELPDGRPVAVKRLKQSALTNKGKSDFAREVNVMANVRHGNVLRLLAYCNEGGERILIYAFMPNKSLDLYIFGNAYYLRTCQYVNELLGNSAAFSHPRVRCVIHKLVSETDGR
jgi:serine/threonine protein kinase